MKFNAKNFFNLRILKCLILNFRKIIEKLRFWIKVFKKLYYIYFDDIIIFSRSLDELKKVFQRRNESNFEVQLDKIYKNVYSYHS